MKHLRLSIVFVVLAVLVIPVTASAQSGGLTYTAGIQIQNLDTSTAADVVVTFYNQDGTTTSPGGSTSFTIAAGGQKTLFPLEGASDGFNGSVVVSSSAEVQAIANVLGNGGAYGASYGGFTAGAETAYVPLLMKANSGYNTWFNVQNTGSAATTVTITYSDGVTASCANLQPGAACTLDQSTEAHASKWVGSAIVTASAGGSIAVAVMEVGPTTLFGYSGFTGGSQNIAIPLVNANNSGYGTGIQIQNLGTEATNVTLSYTPSSAGTACTETRTIAVGKSETFALNAFTSGGSCGAQKFIGSARVAANSTGQDLVAIVNQLNGTANKGAAYEAFDPAKATDTVVMPLVMDRNSNYYTGISVLNVGSSTVTVNCTFASTTHVESKSLAPGQALTAVQGGVIGDRYVGSATCTASGGSIVGIVNELNSVSTGDAFLVYSAFNK